MRKKGGYITYLDAAQISQAERDIIIDFIKGRIGNKAISVRTQGKLAYELVWVCKTLHDHNSSLDTCTVKDLRGVAGDASIPGKFTKNSRQTKITILKGIARYLNRIEDDESTLHHKIDNLDYFLEDVKAGGVAKNRKEALTPDQWDALLNRPMSARDRALLAVMYDGAHRPGEVLIIKWSDLRIDDKSGGISYDIVFKTLKPRTIVQKPATTDILELWRRECGASITDDKPIFPAPDGKRYQSITVIAKMFKKLKKDTGIKTLKPSVIRNTALTHDIDNGMPISYCCLRSWGENYNPLINLYVKANSGRIQRDQHKKNGLHTSTSVLGTSPKFAASGGSSAEREIAELKAQIAELVKGQGLQSKKIDTILKNKGEYVIAGRIMDMDDFGGNYDDKK